MRPRRLLPPYATPSPPLRGPVTTPSGPVAASLPTRPRPRPYAASSPPLRDPVAAPSGPFASSLPTRPRRRPYAAPSPPLVAPSPPPSLRGLVAAPTRPRRRSPPYAAPSPPLAAPSPPLPGPIAAPSEQPSRRAAQQPSRSAAESPSSRAAPGAAATAAAAPRAAATAAAAPAAAAPGAATPAAAAPGAPAPAAAAPAAAAPGAAAPTTAAPGAATPVAAAEVSPYSGSGIAVAAVVRLPFSPLSHYFARLSDAWRTEFSDAAELPEWVELLRLRVDIYTLDYDAILTAMYALPTSDAGDCYLCVPPDPGIEAAALGDGEAAALGASASAAPGAGESALSGTTSTQALHTFTLDSGASHSFFRDRTTLTPLSRPVAVSLVAASSQVFAAASRSGPESAPCWCRLLSHQTLLWHHRLGHPSLPRLQGMTSRVLVSGLPRSLPPLPPGPGPTSVPCVEGRQRAAPHSSEFPPTEAPLQTLHMDVWGLARVSGQGRERYFLLVVDDYSRYTTVFPLHSKGDVTEVLIDWIRAARLQLKECSGSDFLVLRLHSDRGGKFSSARLGAFSCAKGIRQTFTLPASPQQNGIAERRIGMVMTTPRISSTFSPRITLPETSPALRWTGKVDDASAFQVWGSRAFVRDLSADKLSPRAVPCVFLGFPPDAPGWQFYHPTSRRVLSSQDVTFDESVPYCHLFPYRTAPLPPPPLFLAPCPPPVDPLPLMVLPRQVCPR
ncbi:unnamed protein product [Closterium sp. NIES-65]|nr:unnamed protein product [Closterium sp. NIES-65]